MQLSDEVLIAAPRTQVWAALNDSAVLARCIPGCQALEEVSPSERKARVAVKIGPVRATFNGTIRVVDPRPGEGCELHFEGSGGAAGMVKGRSNVTLTDDAGGTRLHYTTDASIAGKLGQVGGRMIDAASKQTAEQFFEAFRRELAPQVAEEVAAHEVQPESANPPTSLTATSAAAVTVATVAAATVHRPRPTTNDSVGVSIGTGERVLWFAFGVIATLLGVWAGRG
jgi:uncharacterized protein